MATTTLSKGESYTFTRTGDVTTLVGSSDHAHGIMRVSNNLYMSASGNITHTIQSATADSNITLKNSDGQFNLGYDKDQSVFNLRTGVNPFGGKEAASTVFSVITNSNIMYVPNMHIGTNSTVGLVASGSTIFRPENLHNNTLTTIFPAPAGNGSLGIGWNFSGGNGEIDFISGRGAGSIHYGGGFAFYDLAKSTDSGSAANPNGILICTMKAHSTTHNSPWVRIYGRLEATAYFNSSDKRLKRDILPIENALDKILMLNGVTYNWNKEFDPDKNLDDDNHIGLLAQDVEKIIPQIVSTDDSKHQLKSMAYTELIPVLIEAIKEQQTQINELKNKLKDTPYG